MILQTRVKIVSIGILNSCFFLLIYFLRTPLHELAFYRLNYPLCLFSHNSTVRLYNYFNQIYATIYFMYPLLVKEFTR